MKSLRTDKWMHARWTQHRDNSPTGSHQWSFYRNKKWFYLVRLEVCSLNNNSACLWSFWGSFQYMSYAQNLHTQFRKQRIRSEQSFKKLYNLMI